MYEQRNQELLPLPLFIRRMALSILLALGIVAAALLVGTTGYHHFAGLRWVDSLLNATMILTGMGPVDTMPSTAAKLFASAYALLSGFVFLMVVGVVLAPVFHRILHKFHIDDA